MDKIEILSTRNFFRQKFGAVCRKIATSRPALLFNPHDAAEQDRRQHYETILTLTVIIRCAFFVFFGVCVFSLRVLRAVCLYMDLCSSKT